MLRTTVTGPIAALVSEATHEYPMVAVAEDLFVVRDPDARTWTAMTFYDSAYRRVVPAFRGARDA